LSLLEFIKSLNVDEHHGSLALEQLLFGEIFASVSHYVLKFLRLLNYFRMQANPSLCRFSCLVLRTCHSAQESEVIRRISATDCGILSGKMRIYEWHLHQIGYTKAVLR
jgi:hypothetical protein